MRSSARYVLILIVFAWFAGCSGKPSTNKTSLDSLISKQVHELLTSHASVTKTSVLGDKEDHITYTPDSLGWEHEFEIFRQPASFERPANAVRFRMQDGIRDTRSNLTVRRYASIEGHSNGTDPGLTYYYFNDFSHLRRVEATFLQGQAMYKAARQMVIEFEEQGGIPVITAYRLEGEQKMVLTDSVRFLIRAEINRPSH